MDLKRFISALAQTFRLRINSEKMQKAYLAFYPLDWSFEAEMRELCGGDPVLSGNTSVHSLDHSTLRLKGELICATGH